MDEPFFVSQPKNITAAENDNVMLTYVVNGSYQIYAFSINGVLYHPEELRNQVMLQGNEIIFTIRNVSLNLHLNSYQCILLCGPQEFASHKIFLYIVRQLPDMGEGELALSFLGLTTMPHRLIVTHSFEIVILQSMCLDINMIILFFSSTVFLLSVPFLLILLLYLFFIYILKNRECTTHYILCAN